MNATRFAIVVLAVSLLASVSVASRADDAGAIEGLYLCQGINPEGQPYSAMLELVRHEGHVRARWTFPVGPAVHGIGLVRQDVLAISYFGAGTAGLAVYRIEDGAITSGEWVAAGEAGVHREFVTRIRVGTPVSEPVAPDGVRVTVHSPLGAIG